MTDPIGEAARPRVAVIYDGFPHYRKGVIEALASSDCYEYFFFGDPVYRDQSIKRYEFAPGIHWIPTKSFSFGHFHFQRSVLRNLFRLDIRHCIFLGNPRFISYWFLVPLVRLAGRKVYFWSHGWIMRDDPRVRGAVKRVFFRMADALLLYGRRSKEIGIALGFPARRLYVIGNSLDYAAQKQIYAGLEGRSQEMLRKELQLPPECKVIICTARVTRKCRFDLLLEAAGILQAANHAVFVVLVGDGPETGALRALAMSLQVPHKFWGACYDETTIAKLYKASDLTVSPGKVGLTAMHSMAYGTPVITHGNFDHQMPEFESIVPNITGDFFSEDSAEDLARVMLKWFEEHREKPERQCIERIEAAFTPWSQRTAIETALRGELPAS